MKKDIIKIIKKKYPKLKKKKITIQKNLTEDFIFDSLEMVSLFIFLEKKYKFDLKGYVSKNNNFVVKNIQDFLNTKN